MSSNKSTLRLCCIQWDSQTTLGLHLSRAPWDPYPWISDVTPESTAYAAGIRSGDCVLEVNGEDILGKKIVQVAEKIKMNSLNNENGVTLLLWNSGSEQNVTPHLLQKFTSILQNLGQLLECPVCFETIKPPARQCCHGHILCERCRQQTTKCPVCRVNLGPRGRCLVADKIYLNLIEPPIKDHKSTSNKELGSISEITEMQQRCQPFRDINYCSIFKDIVSKIKDTKSTRNKFHCPTGGSCRLLSSKEDLFTHLYRNHKLSATQYYSSVGDNIAVNFCDKSVVCVVLPKSSDYFFFVKFIKNIDEEIFWVWHLAEGCLTDESKYKVKFKDSRNNKILWEGKPILMKYSFSEIYNNFGEYFSCNYSVKSLNVKILIK